VTTNNGTQWTLRTNGLPTLYCTRIAVHPTDPASAYAAFSGYSSGAKVYKTTNYGSSWTNVSSNLPNIPVNCVIVDPGNVQHLVIGTDLGIFSSTNGGGAWTQDISGLANVAVLDLDYRASDSKIFASTHGRGMYSAPISGTPVTTITLIYDDGSPQTQYYWGSAGQSSANRMSPPSGTYDLVSMSIYLAGATAGTVTYKPIVLASNGGVPGAALADIATTTFTAYPGWHETNLTAKNIKVTGEFFVGIRYDGVNQPAFGADPLNNNRAWDFNGTSWSAWAETYFMRATIKNASTDISLSTEVPQEFYVSNNYPNPFNPSTTIEYGLTTTEKVSIAVYDLNGAIVARLAEGIQSPGTYSVTWNGKSLSGQNVSSGAYLIAISAGSRTVVKKALLMK
jgi:hypothetical protein